MKRAMVSQWRTIVFLWALTHWGRVTHICVRKLTIIGSDNGLSPGRRQAIIWTDAGILLIRTLGTNFSEIPSEIHVFSFKTIHLKMSSGKRRPFCLGLNVLTSFIICISHILRHPLSLTQANTYVEWFASRTNSIFLLSFVNWTSFCVLFLYNFP